MKKFTLLFVAITILTGCSDLKDLYTLAFPTSMAIDYQDSQYTVTFQIINPNSLSKPEVESSSNNGEILIINTSGNSIGEAIQKLENRTRIEMLLDHVDTLLITPNVLDPIPLKEVLNYVVHDQHLKLSTSLFINTQDINDIYQVKHNITSSPYFSLIAYNNPTNLNALDVPTSMLEIMKTYTRDNSISIIPNLSTVEDSNIISEGEENPAKKFVIDKLTFLNNKETTTLNIQDIYGLTYIHKKSNNNVTQTIPYQDFGINYDILSSKTKTSFKNNKFHINLHISLSLISYPSNLKEEEVITMINRYMKQSIISTYTKLLENNIDYLELHKLSNHPVTINNIEVHVHSRLELRNNSVEHQTID